MRKLLFIFSLFMFAFVAYSCAATVEAIPAQTIIEAFDANEIVGEKEYKGKTIIAEGVVYNITRDHDGNPQIVLQGSSVGLLSFTFPETETDAIADIRKGQMMKIQGVYNRYFAGFIHFKDAKIVQ